MRCNLTSVTRSLCSALIAVTACTSAANAVIAQSGNSPVHRPSVPGAPAGITAFVDVAVIPMDQERVLPHQTVLVEHGRITALGPASQVAVPAGATRIEAQGKYLIPGLADMHMHISGMYNGTDADSVAIRRMFLFVANGVTTVRNMDWGSPTNSKEMGNRALRLRAMAQAGTALIPRIYTSGPWFGTDPKVYQAPVESIGTYVKRYKAAGYDFIKIHNEGPTEADSLIAAARRLSMPVAGHLPSDNLWQTMSPDRLERFLSGYSSIEHLIGYVAALQVGYDTANIKDEPIALPLDLTKIPALIAATRRAGTWNCPTEVNNEGNGLELGTMQLVTSNIIKIRRQIIKGLQDAGTGLLLGTDAGSLLQKPGLASHWELQALVRAGLTPYQALATGTRNVAVFLGWLDDTGTIAVGKRADLMLLNGNPLMDIQQTMNSAGVMLGGRWLARAEIDRRLSDIKGDDKATH